MLISPTTAARRPHRRMLRIAAAASVAFVAASLLAASPLSPDAATAQAAVSVASAASAAPVGTSNASKTKGLNYVALGDSYAAGYGLLPLTGAPVPGCVQSANNYPHQIAAALKMNLTDGTCTSATTANIVTTPQVTAAGVAPLQISALSADTDVVSLTIGGNDVGFFDIASACVSLTPTGPLAYDPTKPNCTAVFNAPGYDQLAAKIAYIVAPAIANTLAAIKVAAPNAKVFVVGYPSITPDAANTPTTGAGCFTPALSAQLPFPKNSFPFSNVDVPYIHSVEVALDKAVQRETEAAGATYVAALSGSVANSACATANPYISGITIESLEPFSMAFGALHPNTAGAAYLTSLVQAKVGAAYCAGTRNGDAKNKDKVGVCK